MNTPKNSRRGLILWSLLTLVLPLICLVVFALFSYHFGDHQKNIKIAAGRGIVGIYAGLVANVLILICFNFVKALLSDPPQNKVYGKKKTEIPPSSTD